MLEHAPTFLPWLLGIVAGLVILAVLFIIAALISTVRHRSRRGRSPLLRRQRAGKSPFSRR
jgi:hypothetical protein